MQIHVGRVHGGPIWIPKSYLQGWTQYPFAKLDLLPQIPKLDPKMNPGLDLKLDFQTIINTFIPKSGLVNLYSIAPCSKPAL